MQADKLNRYQQAPPLNPAAGVRLAQALNLKGSMSDPCPPSQLAFKRAFSVLNKDQSSLIVTLL